MNNKNEILTKEHFKSKRPLLGNLLLVIGGIIVFLSTFNAIFRIIDSPDTVIFESRGHKILGLSEDFLILIFLFLSLIIIVIASYGISFVQKKIINNKFLNNLIGRSSSMVTCVSATGLEVFLITLIIFNASFVTSSGFYFLMAGTVLSAIGGLIVIIYSKEDVKKL